MVWHFLKEIVNLHHGSIYAESPEGQGAVFTVELLMDKEHYRPSEVDFYVSDTETAPTASEEEAVTTIDCPPAPRHSALGSLSRKGGPG